MTRTTRISKQRLLRAIKSHIVLSLSLALPLVLALASAAILGVSLSGRASLVDGVAEAEVGQTRLLLCTFSAPLNVISWGQVINYLMALTYQHQSLTIKTIMVQGSKLYLVLNFSKAKTMISLCPPALFNQTGCEGAIGYTVNDVLINIPAQEVYIKIAKVLHAYASLPSSQKILAEIAILGNDNDGNKISLYLNLVTPRPVLVYMAFTLLAYGVVASLLYLALALGEHAGLCCNSTTIVGTLVRNRGLFLVPIYIILTLLHAGIALSLTLGDAISYTSIELVAIMISFGVLFVFSISYTASAIATLLESKAKGAERIAAFVANIFCLIAYLMAVCVYMIITQMFLPRPSLHQLWLYMLSSYLLNPIKVISPLVASLLAVGLEILIRQRKEVKVPMRPELVLILYYVIVTADLFILIMRPSFSVVGYSGLIIGGSFMILLLFTVCTGVLLVVPPCNAVRSESELRKLLTLLAVPALVAITIMIVTARTKTNVTDTEILQVTEALAAMIYFYAYPYLLAMTSCLDQSTQLGIPTCLTPNDHSH